MLLQDLLFRSKQTPPVQQPLWLTIMHDNQANLQFDAAETVEMTARRFLKLQGLRTMTTILTNPSQYGFYYPPTDDQEDGIWLESYNPLSAYNLPENVFKRIHLYLSEPNIICFFFCPLCLDGS